MKNLLGTHLGHSTLFTMCRFLQESNLKNDAGLMRGCVFYIHMALWDISAMQNLCCPPSSVLPSILQVFKKIYLYLLKMSYFRLSNVITRL